MKMLRVSLMVDGSFTTKNEEIFVFQKDLEHFVLNTDFEKYKFISFASIEVYDPTKKEETK